MRHWYPLLRNVNLKIIHQLDYATSGIPEYNLLLSYIMVYVILISCVILYYLSVYLIILYETVQYSFAVNCNQIIV